MNTSSTQVINDFNNMLQLLADLLASIKASTANLDFKSRLFRLLICEMNTLIAERRCTDLGYKS